MTARPLALAVVVAAALALVAPAGAHSGGRAVPEASLSIRQVGPLRALLDVRVRDEDGGEPVRGAELRGFGRMARPHTVYTYFGPLPETEPGRYRTLLRLPMAARWKIELTIGGPNVVTRQLRARS